ncbi:MAG: hypothetical protein ACK5O3_03495 [Burkholderiales bacterium]|jgi:hypothetical protein
MGREEMKLIRVIAFAASLLGLSAANAQSTLAATAQGQDAKPTITKNSAPSAQTMAGIRALLARTAPKVGRPANRLSRDGVGAMSLSSGCDLAESSNLEGCFTGGFFDYYSFQHEDDEIDLIIPKAEISAARGVIVCANDICERYSGFETIDHEWVEQRVGEALTDHVHDWVYGDPPSTLNMCRSSRSENKTVTKNSTQAQMEFAASDMYRMLMNWYTNYANPTEWTKERTQDMVLHVTFSDGATANFRVHWGLNTGVASMVSGSLKGGTGVARSAC